MSKIEKRVNATKSSGTQCLLGYLGGQTDFIGNLPDENTPLAEQTKSKILYGSKFLYFAFRYYGNERDNHKTFVKK